MGSFWKAISEFIVLQTQRWLIATASGLLTDLDQAFKNKNYIKY